MELPASYQDWRYCIEHICRESLSAEYIDRRLQDLRDPKNYYNQRFIQLYGEQHYRQVIAWFEQAQRQLPHARL